VIEQLFEHLAPPRVVYVSCHAESLARELPRIVASGYRVTAIRPVDMFPHTPHVEVVTVLDREKSGPTRKGARHRW
jgi:23S rRNA (uracil1939-C5)-methyltransferase